MAADLVLAGDIGGTNCRLTLFSIPRSRRLSKAEGASALDGHQVVFSKTYKNDGQKNFAVVLHTFYRESGVGLGNVAAACFAVAGPVKNNTVTFTNLGWNIEGRDIEREFQIPEDCVTLVNDFVAVGYGLLTLEDGQYHELQKGTVDRSAPIACLGAGTGLGEVFLTSAQDRYTACPSEGGHKEYCPRNELEIDLLAYLQKKFCGRVSVERVVSGKGLMNVYEFLRDRYPDKVIQKYDDEIMAAKEGAAKISQYIHDYPLCQSTMNIMSRAYGTEAGNLALQFLPFGGLYITQGIITKNLDFFLDEEKSEFMAAYRDKGRVSHFTKQIPLRIAKADDLGMKGAHLVASRTVKDAYIAQRASQFSPVPPMEDGAAIPWGVALVALAACGFAFMRSKI
mmetsp:Transcript_19821/g.59201  ORF Transcript_19821/g.59201 Transcript_19821/m.59201 type:complete len:396 (-) Transcript_19821:234-1421(-)